jgi:two-component system, chemotaxis family, chemotaxis protein CheY
MHKILIVDDSDVIRTELQGLLVKEGYAVTAAASGTEGLTAALEQGPFELIITDYNMPGLNGVEMCFKIRQDARYTTTPILVLTTESSTDLRKKGQEIGVRAWLVKPINADVMRKVLAKLFNVAAAS